jgi:hypothetical protein
MGDSRCERAMVDRHNVGQLHGLEPDGTHNVPTISQPSELQFRPKTGAHFDAWVQTRFSFIFNILMVSFLADAWKMPINISQDSYERVKRSASPVLLPKKAKKVKTENTDENDNVNDECVDANSNYRILFSMSSEVELLQKYAK